MLTWGCAGHASASSARRPTTLTRNEPNGLELGAEVATYAVAVRRSALVAVVPAVVPVVDVHRLRHDPMATRGVPAHVTILYPFRPVVDGPAAGRIDDICRGFAPFHTTFATVDRFPGGVVWLRPEPDDTFIALTRAFVDAFPDCPPDGGEFAEIIPHLTVGSGLDATAAELLQETLASRLPVSATVERLTLLGEDDAGIWHVVRSWQLQAFSSDRHS